MDKEICEWVLEFLVCHPRVSDGAVKLALSMLPLPDKDFLRKSMVLRSIQSEIYEASISEKLLEYIEVVEEIDRNTGKPILESMKEAYRAVAVECCVRYIHGARPAKLGKFAEAVRRIWTGRIRVMERSAIRSGLLTPELLKWGHRIETAVGNGTECLNLMMINTRADAFRAVEGYVTDAFQKMGPSFLETIAARENISSADDKAESAGQADAQVSRQERSIPLEDGEEIGFSDHRAESDSDARVSQQDQSIPLEHGEGVQIGRQVKEPVEMHELHRSKQPPRHKRKATGPSLRSTGDATDESLRTVYDFIPSPDVNKVQAALRNSSSELQQVVEDPLPDALRVARSFGSADPDDLPQEQTGKVATTKDADNNGEVNPPILEEHCPNRVPNHQTAVQKPTLMERKSSARTDEWEDSLEDPIEESTSDAERPMLSSRKRRAVSPLRIPRVTRLSVRRIKKKWSAEEEDALRRGVQRFGKGNWKVILHAYSNIFDGRTEVDLKDKWRNITR
ncbi:hypothetical protein MLD38_017496 [Melastoma candidum]|uniref:Uncharacterized protein n=1 Tax=Melastoma candidum TaxID=119954 RepID=A0ACB9QQ08_9MYRT|nr:hypothetical protein MLD38_017496 [Melastoma candidum]